MIIWRKNWGKQHGIPMTDYAAARENMIESQVRPNGITDHRIIAAMAGLAREDFVPEERKAVAYMDADVLLSEAGPGGTARYLIEAMAFARLVHLAVIRPTDKILHVGAATGYGSAVLIQLGDRVVALESDAELAGRARKNLAGEPKVKLVEGRLAEGSKADGPFDVIMVEGRVGEIPAGLLAQLADGGRLVAVVGEGDVAKAHVWTRSGAASAVRTAFDASIAALPGFARKVPAFVF